MFEGLKKLLLAVGEEGEKLANKGDAFNLESIIFNKRFRKGKKPGPKINLAKRIVRVEKLSSKLNCPEIIRKISEALIKNWFYGCKIGYNVCYDDEHRIPIPHWYISEAGAMLPELIVVNFRLEADFEKGRPVNPMLFVSINFAPDINPWSRFSTITLDEVYSQIRDMFERVFGEFADKKEIRI